MHMQPLQAAQLLKQHGALWPAVLGYNEYKLRSGENTVPSY
jgi:hypothetical protein